MIPVIVKLCESPSRAGGLLMINYWYKLSLGLFRCSPYVITRNLCSYTTTLWNQTLRNVHEIKSPMKYVHHRVGADLSALGE